MLHFHRVVEGTLGTDTRQTKSRREERRAVNAARTYFEEHDLVFQEIDLRNDVGNDAILDLARSGTDAGLSVALQIKGGKKYKRSIGHAIPIDKRLRKIWLNSSLPVYFIVRDVEDGELYWGNARDTIKAAEERCRDGSIDSRCASNSRWS